MHRAAVIVVEEGELALIERVRGGRTYFLFPGGGVEPGESPEDAAVREAREELGLDVELGPLVALVQHEGAVQGHFLARVVGGEFGGGEGPEMGSPTESEAGSFRAVRVPLADLDRHDVRPRELARAVARGGLGAGRVLRLVD